MITLQPSRRTGVRTALWLATTPRTRPADLTPGSFEVAPEAIDAHARCAEETGDLLITFVPKVTKEPPAHALHAS